MSHRFRLLACLLAVALTANLVVGWRIHHEQMVATGEGAGYKTFDELENVTRLIRSNYVDADKANYENLKEGAIRGMLNQLDPFSGYFPPAYNKEIEEQTQGEFGGIGVTIGVEDNQITVIEPMPNSPGERAGLQPRDRIIEVNGKPLGETTVENAVRLIKGEPGTAVELTVIRPATHEVKHVRIVRDIIELPSVTDTCYVADGIGYTRIVQFTQKTPEELKAALVELGNTGKFKGLILDLRYNPGGLLQAAQEVCSLFLDEGQLVVSTEGRTPDQRERYYSLPGMKTDVPLVILINGMSASASEIVSGCMQDTGRGVLVGEKSFGKGTVQTPFYLSDGGSIHLTTARYYTPSHRVIHGHGLMPDVVVKADDDPDHKPFRKPRDGAPLVIKDVQLLKAMEVMENLWKGIHPPPPPPPDVAAKPGSPTPPADNSAAKPPKTWPPAPNTPPED